MANGILPNFQTAIGENFVFVHNNGHPYRSEIMLERLEELGVDTLQLLPRSSDLNPTEYTWDMQKLPYHQPRPNTLTG